MERRFVVARKSSTRDRAVSLWERVVDEGEGACESWGVVLEEVREGAGEFREDVDVELPSSSSASWMIGVTVLVYRASEIKSIVRGKGWVANAHLSRVVYIHITPSMHH